MKKQLVLCHYKGRLDWVDQVKGYEVTIYDKGGDGKGIAQPNVGREHYSYITHILDNYDKLADLTVFSQGDPIEHQQTFVKRLNELPNDTQFQALGAWYVESDYYGFPHEQLLIGGIPLKRVYETLFEKPCPSQISCYANSLFAASKQRIRSRSFLFYERMLKQIDYEHTPVEVFCLERLWHIVLGEQPMGSLRRNG